MTQPRENIHAPDHDTTSNNSPQIRSVWKLRLIDPARAEATWQLLCQLRDLIRDAQGIDTRYYEQHESATIRRELVPALQRLLERSETQLACVFDHYEAASKGEKDSGPCPELSFESTLDELMSTSSAARRIADISFIARMELARVRYKLSNIKDTDNHWEYVTVCASIRRRVLKSADSLERAICQHEDLPSDNGWHENSVQLGLMTRRAYAIFAHSLKIDSPPADDELYKRVRSAGSALAKLIGRDGYEDFKIEDRQLLRTTQQRVLEWLRRGQRDEDEVHMRAGMRIWQDVVGVANLILQVSNRPELIEHDSQVIERLARVVARGEAEAQVLDAGHQDELRSLYGLDRELDGHIASNDLTCTDALRAVLEGLRARRR